MPASETVEREVRALCDAGDHAGAATAALRGYGPELYSFLAAIHRDDADDVFAEVSAKIWRGLPAFGWQSSLRTWAYVIARNTSLTARTRGGREVPLAESEAEKLAVEVRTATKTYLRTDAKTKFAEIRAALPIEDQELLILRVDRGLDWKELAQTLAGADLDDAALKREAARLRKRFQVLKDKLLEAGRAAGLVGTRS
ncbi:MAG TPA: sigma-70 family RNA polymerase sigma factor [Kofleriaceae bacterium]|nr:sigma-70 family RNA polymerase sigma factor [Kofleriaceae bacterium]